MKFLSNYLDFIFEAVSKQEMRLYYSDDFRNVLRRIQNNSGVAQALLLSEDSNQMVDIYTLIDITEKNDTISLIQVSRITRGNPEYNIGNNRLPYNIRDKKMRSDFWNKARTEMKVGRWAKRILTEVIKKDISDSKIEEFVNLYKSTIDGEDLTNFELVRGEDIRKWYYENNYEERRGQLGNSCMRYHSCQSYLDIYVKNPDVCQLLILKSDNKDKIKGRALVWKLSDGEYYMDRVYTINDSDKLLFQDYARINKIKNTYDGSSDSNLEVKLGDYTYEKYPYMDTFVVYNPTTKVLEADEELWPGQGYISIQNTNGGFGAEDAVYSEWQDEYLNRESAVYCSNVRDWLSRDEARYLEYKDTWVAPTDEVVWSEYHGEYFYEDDVVYSEIMSDTLYPDNENVIEIEINSSGDTDWCVKSREDIYIEQLVVGETKYFLRDNLIKDPYDGEYHFKDEKIDGVKYEEYLDEKIKKDIGITAERVTREEVNKVKEELINLLREFNITDKILKEIKDSIYWKSINVYWGISKENMPTNEDVFYALKGWMTKSSNDDFNPNKRSYNYSSKIERYYNDCVKFIDDETTKRKFSIFRSDSDLLRNIAKISYSFDYSLFPDEIYKRYIFINLSI